MKILLDKFSLRGQVGVVTGGGQGLGRVFSLAFAEAGASVVVAELNPDTGPKTVKEIETYEGEALFVKTDVRERTSINAMVEKTVKRFGHLDFLMNNAGIVKWCPAESVTENDWREVIDVNLNGLFYCSQAAAKQMIQQKSGCIINIASMSGYIVNRPQSQASYNASKAAVIHLTRSLATEWAQYNIRVNAIAPGYMDTAMTHKAFEDPAYGPIWTDGIPMGRPGRPEELAPLAVFLASEASSYVTGSTILIDGGYTSW
jgi:NAD(P)-dependent dehydrogenase (short-subunit alcohol dehydrogenase family)